MIFREKKSNKNQLIFVLASAVIAIIVIGVTSTLLTTIEKQLRHDVQQEVGVLTEQAAYNANDHILMTEEAIESFTLQSSKVSEIQPALLNLKDSFKFVEVAYYGKDGTGCRADGSPFTDQESSPASVESTKNGVNYHESHLSSSGTYVYQASKKIIINEEEVGTLFVGIPTDIMMSKKEFSIFEGEGSFVLFKGRTGEIIVGPEGLGEESNEETLFSYLFRSQQEEDNGFPFFSSAYNTKPVEQLAQAVKQGDSALVTTNIRGETTYVCVSPVGAGDYYMCGLVPESSVRSEISSINLIFIIVFIIIFSCLLAVLAMVLYFYQKRIEERGIELRNHLYGALSDSLEMAVNMYSPEDAIVTPIVAKAHEIVGYPMADFIGNKRVAERIGLSESGQILLIRLREGIIMSTERGEFSMKNRRTNDTRWVSYSVTPLFFENKHQLLIVFRDSTNEKNLHLSMKEAMVAAETANHAKSDFLSRMSHEIRTPMNAIIGMTQIAQKHSDNTLRVRESLDKIILASDHLLSLINDVLDISKIESGKMMLVRKRFSFTELIEQVTTVAIAQSEAKGQSFTYEETQLLEEYFMGDQVRLKQVLINLLTNAVKYTPPRGSIVLKITQNWSAVRGYVQVTAEIIDNGIGMTDEFLEHIFEPFVMEGRTSAQGTGLGMPIVKNIITMMNGDIQIKSEVDKGTKFSVVVNIEIAKAPAAKTEAEMIEVEAKSHSAENERTKEIKVAQKSEEMQVIDLEGVRVLLAEDNELNAEIARELLTDSGLIVEHARDGEQACQMFLNSEPGYYDIILMDIQMPIKTGHEATIFIRELDRKDAQKISIVAMSANAFMEDVQASLRSGMNAHISKPINIQSVLEVIAEQTRKHD